MGLSNRDYYQDGDEFGGGGRGIRANGPMSVVAKLILVTVIGYVVSTLLVENASLLRLSAEGVKSGQLWRLLTYGFVAPAGGEFILWFALAMYVLYFTGNMILPLIGSAEFVWLYVSTILVGGIASIADPLTPAENLAIPGLGAGAMFLWAAMRYPHHKIMLMFIIPVEFWMAAALGVIVAVWATITAAGQGVVSVGPVLAVMIFAASHQYYGWRFTRLRESLAALKPKPKSKLRVYAPEEPSRDDDLSLKVDAILEKISLEGEASLTNKERKILKQASKQYKDRV